MIAPRERNGYTKVGVIYLNIYYFIDMAHCRFQFCLLIYALAKPPLKSCKSKVLAAFWSLQWLIPMQLDANKSEN